MSDLKLVAWSGGCDSTLALYEALAQQKVWYNDGKPVSEVRSIAISHPCLPCWRQQKRARAALLREFKSRGLNLRHIELTVTSEGDWPRRGKNGGDVQSQLWIGSMTPYLTDHEDLVLGWTQGEFDHLQEVAPAFEALQRLNGKNGQLQFPLRYRSKPDIVDRLRELELLDLCWWCEGCEPKCKCDQTRKPSTNVVCGGCNKCIAHETALWQLSRFGLKAFR